MAHEIVIETAAGRLRGAMRDGVAVFKAIPYGAPPAGRARFAPPEPVRPWSGVRPAIAPGAMALQAPTQLEQIMGAAQGTQDEDCLTLNVYTPGTSGRRPVMVWIHGGAFVHGAGSIGLYSGRNLAAAGDVVVVTINYRLGALGFLDLGAATGGRLSGANAGLHDQIAALRWVREEIAAFGGDPGNVTIFGESAGAMSVASLIAAPAARGLFHKAIAQSGAGHVVNPRERAERLGAAFLGALGLGAADAEKLYTLPASALLSAQTAVLTEAAMGDPRRIGTMPFQPSVDGASLSDRPHAVFARGEGAAVPLLTGTTDDEWRLFSALDPRFNTMDEAGFAKWADKRLPDARIADAYAGIDAPFARFNAVQTDRVFRVPAIRMAEAQGEAAPVFMYRFDWRSPLMGGIFGAAHALELGFVFGTHSIPGASSFFGDGEDARRLSADMIGVWTRFAHTGDPATAATGLWPRYEAHTRAVMRFDAKGCEAMAAPGEAHRAAWDGVEDLRLGS